MCARSSLLISFGVASVSLRCRFVNRFGVASVSLRSRFDMSVCVAKASFAEAKNMGTLCVQASLSRTVRNHLQYAAFTQRYSSIALASLRLTFGGKPCPSIVSEISEATCYSS